MSRSAGSDGKTHAWLRLVFLQDVVLHGAAELFRGYALPLSRGHVETEQDDRGPVDGHRDRDAVQGDLVEERFHVREGRDGHAADPHLAE